VLRDQGSDRQHKGIKADGRKETIRNEGGGGNGFCVIAGLGEKDTQRQRPDTDPVTRKTPNNTIRGKKIDIHHDDVFLMLRGKQRQARHPARGGLLPGKKKKNRPWLYESCRKEESIRQTGNRFTIRGATGFVGPSGREKPCKNGGDLNARNATTKTGRSDSRVVPTRKLRPRKT